MSVCTNCGKNDQEPLAACPKCTLGEQGDADLPVIDDLRRQLAAVKSELAAARAPALGVTQELEIDRLREDVETFSAAHDAAAMLWDDSRTELDAARAEIADLKAERECILATQKHWIFSTRELIVNWFDGGSSPLNLHEQLAVARTAISPRGDDPPSTQAVETLSAPHKNEPHSPIQSVIKTGGEP